MFKKTIKPVYGVMVLLMFFFAGTVQAGTEIYTNYLSNSGVVSGALLEHQDDQYAFMSSHPTTWPNSFTNYSVKNRIVLELNRANNTFVGSSFTSTVNVTIKYWDASFVPHTLPPQNLVVTYDPTTTNTINDLAIYEFTGGHKVEVTINSISYNPGFLILSSYIDVERYYTFNTSFTPTTLTANVSAATDNEIEIAWPVISGAEEYDLEWVYINDYDGNGGYLATSALSVDFKHNATRVTTTANYWRITPMFEHGYIAYRVRGVGRMGSQYTKAKLGKWSSADVVTLNTHPHKFAITTPLGSDLINWAYHVSYTEEGKKFEVVQYVDGLGFNRQTIGKNYTDNLALVQENYYDNEGRLGVSSLPAPDGQSHLQHRAAFNLNTSSAEYSRADFDNDNPTNSCLPSIGAAMKQTNGTAQYYSVNNTTQTFQQAYVPDASGYPFVRFEYMPDQTGRIQRSGAAGPDYQLNSGHEAKMDYALADQNILNKLFGTDAGYNSNYQRDVVTDANGQKMVTYTNQNGQVVATALAGAKPTSLDILSTNTGAVAAVTPVIVPGSTEQSTDPNTGTISYAYNFLVDQAGNYSFEYGFVTTDYSTCLPEGFCFDCVYDINIVVKDLTCGSSVIYTKTETINGSSLNTTCDQPNTYSIAAAAFTMALTPGNYSISKTLTVNAASVDYYAHEYIMNANCLHDYNYFFQQAFDSIAYLACDLDPCELSCVSQLGSQSQYIAAGGTAAEYQAALAECISDCENVQPDPCEQKRQALLRDLYPGGQYALYTVNASTGVYTATDPLSILNTSNSLHPTTVSWRTPSTPYLNNDGSTAYIVNSSGVAVVPGDASISLAEFVTNFQEKWAESLLPFHPEYCYLQYCNDNLSANTWLQDFMQVETFDEAVAGGWINPLNMSTSQGLPNSSWTNTSHTDPYFGTYYSEMVGDLQNYVTYDGTNLNIWQTAYLVVYGNGDTTSTGISTLLGSATWLPDECLEDRFWSVFKKYYIDARRRIYEREQAIYAITNHCYSGCFNNDAFDVTLHDFDCFPTSDTPVCDNVYYAAMRDPRQPCSIYTDDLYAGKIPHFTDLSAEPDQHDSHAGLYTSITTEMYTELTADCDDICNSYADDWMLKLSGCALTPSQSTAIRAELIELCKLGCDADNPLGSSSTPTGVATANGNHNFDEILEYHLGASYPTAVCSYLLLDEPGPYNSGTLLDVKPIDACACDKILTVMDRYNSGQPLPAGVHSPEELFQHMYGYPAGDIKAWSCNCNDAWTAGSPSTPFEPGLTWQSASITYLSSLSPAVYVPGPLACSACISCTDLSDKLTDFAALFPGLTEDDPNYQEMFTTYMNNAFNFNLSYGQYQDFLEDCNTGGETGPISCNATPELNEMGQLLSEVLANGKLFTDYANAFNLPPATSFETMNLATYTAGTYFWSNYSYSGDQSPLTFNIGVPGGSACTITLSMSGNEPHAYWSHLLTLDNIQYISSGCGSSNNFMLIGTFEFHPGTVIDTLYGTSSCYPMVNCDCGPQLCNEVLSPDPFDPCLQSVIDLAQLQADEQYQAYLTEQEALFREDYMSNCYNSALNSEYLNFNTYDYEYQYTLYYYDQAGNLVRTVAPKGLDAAFVTTTVNSSRNSGTNVVPSHTFQTQYRYNSYGQVIQSTSPDAGTTSYYYDRYGRIALSQNAKQAAGNQYSYTRYDIYGRPFEAGQLSGASPTTITETILKTPSSLDSWITSATRVQVTRTYYDATLDASVAAKFNAGQSNLRLRVTTVAYYESYTGSDLSFDHATHFSYDLHGNVTEQLQDDPQLAYLQQNVKHLQYTFQLISGNVQKVEYQKGKTDQYIHKYNYDADDRLKEVYTSRGGSIWDRDGKYFYYQHGPLARVERGEYKVQAEDYAYTINGWLKGVNAATLNETRDMGTDGKIPVSGTQLHQRVGRDKFGYTLGYYLNDYKAISNPSTANNIELDYAGTNAGSFGTATKALYNGNIANAVYSIGSLSTQGYTYTYDQLQRIKGAQGHTGANTGANTWSTGTALTNYSTQYTYDANGNILTLKRNGNAGLTMDDLTYNYTSGTNRLAYVDDAIGSGVFVNVDVDDQAAGNYAYTQIGELTQDTKEEIATIEWRVDGKIKKITRTGTSNKPQVEFEYDAFGRRVLKLVKPVVSGVVQASSTWTYTYYVNDAHGNIMAVYTVTQNGTVKTYALKEQYVYGKGNLGTHEPNDALATYNVSTSVLTNATIDTKKRILGNKKYIFENQVRSVMIAVNDRFVPHNASGSIDYFTAQVILESDYYPFGQLMPGRNNNPTNFRNGFQEQQKDDEIFSVTGSLETAEFWEYDTRLGRRWNVDPITRSSQSSYATFNNNPVVFTDPLGLKPGGGGKDKNVENSPVEGQPYKAPENTCGGGSFSNIMNTIGNFLGKHPELKGMLTSAGGGGAGSDNSWDPNKANNLLPEVDISTSKESSELEVGYRFNRRKRLLTLTFEYGSRILAYQVKVGTRVRKNYLKEVAPLLLEDTFENRQKRFGLKVKYRELTPSMERSILNYTRPLEEEAKKIVTGSNPGKTNAKVDKSMVKQKMISNGLILFGVYNSISRVVDSKNPKRQAAKEVLSWTGSVTMGEEGGEFGLVVGSYFGPIGGMIGSFIGAIGGAILGGFLGDAIIPENVSPNILEGGGGSFGGGGAGSKW